MQESLDIFRSSTIGWLRGTLAGWATLIAAAGGVVAAIALGEPLFLLLPALALLLLLVLWIRNLATTFELCEDRLLIRHGILFKSIDEIELYRVKDVRIDFTLINQWADIGTISISSSDETTRNGDLVLRHVERARERRENLRRLVDVARQRRQVREIDMVHEDF